MTVRLLIVGTGLIGTSIGLALGSAAEVALLDTDEDNLALAVARGAGHRWDGGPVQHAVLALPPRLIPIELARLYDAGAASTFSHVASAQAVLHSDIETFAFDTSVLCGSHPLAGRERSGPQAAASDLFLGRPWALCPSTATSAAALARTRQLALDCGADPVTMTAEEHDAAVALVSHLPQVAASAVAAVLHGAARPGEQKLLRLAGPGLQDTTRIAASDPALWVDVLRQNAAAVAPLVRSLATELDETAQALQRLADGDASGDAVVADLLTRGRAGRERVPVKHGAQDSAFAVVSITVTDSPGQLAGVLLSAAEAGVNVEDVRVEHLPGRPRGVIELLVHADARAQARRALAAAGWEVLA